MREMGSGSKHGNWLLDRVHFVSWQQGRQGKIIQAKGMHNFNVSKGMKARNSMVAEGNNSFPQRMKVSPRCDTC